MAITQRLNRWQFVDEFKKVRPHNFTYEGLHALYDYLEQLSEDIGNDIEFDPISICCDFSEYDTFKQFQNDYDYIESFDELREKTNVILLGEGDKFIMENF